MKKLLWIGDAGVPSGFARATHEILDTLRYVFDVTVLGMNYQGDPNPYPYPIYAAAPGGDPFGVGRLVWMCDRIKPDVIVIQNDGWNIPHYVQQLVESVRHKDIPVVAAVAVDGENFRGSWLNGISLTVFWTQFALNEARKGGYKGAAVVIPLGVDVNTYRPMDKSEARRARKIDSLVGQFVVGNVNRNQPRKRWDLTVRYFAEWIRTSKVKDAWLYLHTAPTGDVGVDVVRLAQYYGVLNRLAFLAPETFYGIEEADMCATYNSFDVQISTTQGEGFGLTTMEGAACGVLQIVPGWSALGEIFKDAALIVPCTSTAIGAPYVNVIGGVPDQDAFVRYLDIAYSDKRTRTEYSERALARAREERFRWANVGDEWLKALQTIFSSASEEAWADLGRAEA